MSHAPLTFQSSEKFCKINDAVVVSVHIFKENFHSCVANPCENCKQSQCQAILHKMSHTQDVSYTRCLVTQDVSSTKRNKNVSVVLDALESVHIRRQMHSVFCLQVFRFLNMPPYNKKIAIFHHMSVYKIYVCKYVCEYIIYTCIYIYTFVNM